MNSSAFAATHRAKTIALDIYFLLIPIETVIGLAYLMRLPTDPKNLWFLGYSWRRWLLILGLCFILALTSLFVFFWFRNRSWGQKVSTFLGVFFNQKRYLILTMLFFFFFFIVGVWFGFFWARYTTNVYRLAYIHLFAVYILLPPIIAFQTLLLIPFFNREIAQAYTAIALSTIAVLILDTLTNTININAVRWDSRFYMLLAEHGVSANRLIAPFIYRYPTPLLAHKIAYIFYRPTIDGFKALAYLGGILQLFSIYLLFRFLKYQFKTFAMALFFIAFSMYNIKFLVFDIYRPDHLAYFLMALAVLALWKNQPVICLIISFIGIQFREFLIAPPLLLAYYSFVAWWGDRSKIKPLVIIIASMFVVGVSFFLPRILIPVLETHQFIDPFNSSQSLRSILVMVFDIHRIINLIMSVIAYFLPVLLFMTIQRFNFCRKQLSQYRSFIILYSGLVIFLAFLGGSDFTRFVTYLFIPMVMILGCLIETGIPYLEMGYAFLAVFIFNRIFLPIPNDDLDAYLDFYSWYAERINMVTLLRTVELIVFWGGAFLLRRIIRQLPKDRYQ